MKPTIYGRLTMILRDLNALDRMTVNAGKEVRDRVSALIIDADNCREAVESAGKASLQFERKMCGWKD